MKRRLLWFLLMLVLVIVAVAWFLFAPASGPTYEGKSAGYWFNQYDLSQNPPTGQMNAKTSEMEDASLNAFDAMGTNAVPYLVHELFSTWRDSSVCRYFSAAIQKLPERWHIPHPEDGDQHHEVADDLLEEITPPPELVLPLVTNAFNSTNAFLALAVFEAADTNHREVLVPWLVKELHSSDDDVRAEAANILDDIQPPAAEVLPDLISALDTSGTNTELANHVVDLVGKYGADAVAAIPALAARFNQETNQDRRIELAGALCRIDAGQTNALRYLVDCLTNLTGYRSPVGAVGAGINVAPGARLPRNIFPGTPPELVQMTTMIGSGVTIVDQLTAAGTNALAAAPALIGSLQSSLSNRTGISPHAYLVVLRSIGAPPETYLPILRQQLEQTNGPIQNFFAWEIFQTDPHDSTALRVLIDDISAEPWGTIGDIRALGEAGSNSVPAIPALQAALNGTNSRLWLPAATSLEKIGAPADSYLPRVRALMRSGNFEDSLAGLHLPLGVELPSPPNRVKLAGIVLDLSPGDPEAFSLLEQWAGTNSDLQLDAIQLLGQRGRADPAAISALKPAVLDKHHAIRKAATAAVNALQPAQPAK
jgi:HEAT repeats